MHESVWRGRSCDEPPAQPDNQEQGSDGEPPTVGSELLSVSRLLRILARLGGHSVDGPGLRGLRLQTPGWEAEEAGNPGRP